MHLQLLHKTVCASALAALLLFASCDKSYNVVNPILPIVNYSYLIYDSVEGHSNTYHYPVQRIINFQYDPNVDKCFMAQPTDIGTGIDTFDRSDFWKRGYINRRDLQHRIIFNADTITIHHRVNNTVGQKNFRYINGVKI